MTFVVKFSRMKSITEPLCSLYKLTVFNRINAAVLFHASTAVESWTRQTIIVLTTVLSSSVLT